VVEGGGNTVEASSGLERHEHTNDDQGGLIPINGGTKDVLTVGRGGTYLTSYSKGELLLGTSTGVLRTLSLGSDGQVLTVSDGDAVWSASVGGGADGFVNYYVHTAGDTMTGALTIKRVSGTLDQNLLTVSGGRIIIKSTAPNDDIALIHISGGSLDVSGNANISGTLLIVGSITSRGNLTLNADQTAADTILTFGSDTTNETLTFINAEDTLEWSDDFQVTGNLAASGKLVIDGGAELNSTVKINGVTYTFPFTDGTATGKVLKTDSAGNLSWSTDSNDGGDKINDYYVRTGGDTMTGALTIKRVSGTLDQNLLTVSGGRIIIKSTAPDNDIALIHISGGSLDVSGNANISGSLLVVGSITTRGAISGSTLNISSGSTFGYHITPSRTNAVDIGSDGKRFRDLYLSGGTIHMGDETNDVLLQAGSGSPVGNVASALGSMYFDHNGGKVYIKTQADGASTGWEELVTGSGTLHMAKMTRDAAQSMPHNINTKISLDTEQFDVGGIADVTTTGSGRITIKKAGKYLVTGIFGVTAGAGDDIAVSLFKNNVEVVYSSIGAELSADSFLVTTTDVLDLAIGDYIELFGRQFDSASAAKNTIGGSKAPRLSVIQLNVVAGADLAEIYYTHDDTIQAGDLVSLDPASPALVRRSSTPYDPNMLGIISAKPGIVLSGSPVQPADTRQVLLGLAGRVPVKVTAENGSIAAGDLLTASERSGIAMRADHGPVVARALEPFSGSGVSTIMAFIDRSPVGNPIHFNTGSGMVLNENDLFLNGSGSGALQIDQYIDRKIEQKMNEIDFQSMLIPHSALLQSENMTGSGGEVLVTQTEQIQESMGTMEMTMVKAVRDIAILQEQIGEFEADGSGSGTVFVHEGIAVVGNANFAGKVRIGGEVTFDDTLYAEAINVEEMTVGAKLIVSDDARIGGDLFIEGELNVADLFIPGMLRIDGGAEVTTTLKAGKIVAGSGSQIEGLLVVDGDIHMSSGSLVLGGSGSIFVGNLFVHDAMQVLGDIMIHGLARFLGDVEVAGILTVSGALVLNEDQGGYAIIPKTATAVTVLFGSGRFLAPPIVTASADVPILFGVSKATLTGFTIHLAYPASESVTFSWIALGTLEARTVYGRTSEGWELPEHEPSSVSSESSSFESSVSSTPLLERENEEAPTGSGSVQTGSGTIIIPDEEDHVVMSEVSSGATTDEESSEQETESGAGVEQSRASSESTVNVQSGTGSTIE